MSESPQIEALAQSLELLAQHAPQDWEALQNRLGVTIPLTRVIQSSTPAEPFWYSHESNEWHKSGGYLKFEDAVRNRAPECQNLSVAGKRDTLHPDTIDRLNTAAAAQPLHERAVNPHIAPELIAKLDFQPIPDAPQEPRHSAPGIATLRVFPNVDEQQLADLLEAFPLAQVVTPCPNCGKDYPRDAAECPHCVLVPADAAREALQERAAFVAYQAMRDNTQVDLTDDRRLKGSQRAWAGYAVQRLINQGFINV